MFVLFNSAHSFLLSAGIDFRTLSCGHQKPQLGNSLIILCIVYPPMALIHCDKTERELFLWHLIVITVSLNQLQPSIIISLSLLCCGALIIKVFSDYLY